ncbi:hypothetical protein Syun_014688 [Stephania yunnanensis]
MFALFALLLYLSMTTTSKTQLAEALSSKEIMSSNSMQQHRYQQSQFGTTHRPSTSQIHLNSRPPLCRQLQRKHNYHLRHPPPSPPPPPSSPSLDEIDPRYGVEKRLVPTGPNPLHN